MATQDLSDLYLPGRPLRTLGRWLAPKKWQLVGSFLLYGIKHSPVWLLPLVTADAIDVLVQQEELSRLYWNAAIILVLVLQNLPMNVWYSMTLSKVLRDLELRLRSALTQRIQELSMGFWNRMNVGSLQSKVVRDVENVELGLRQAGNGGFAAIYGLLGALSITAIKVPQFLIFYAAVVPIAATVMTLSRRRLNSRNEDYRAAVEQMAVRTTEMMGLVPVTRAHGLEETAVKGIAETYHRTRKAALRLDFVNASFGALAWVVFNLANGLCLIAAVWAARTGLVEISAGEVVMLVAYFTMLSSSVVLLVDLVPTFARSLASVRSIGEVLISDDVEPNAGKTKPAAVSGAIEFQSVSFRYAGADKNAVTDVSFAIQPGEYVAVAGPSGSGKSTLANLLIGFIRPQSGRILIDGVDAASLDYRALRKFMAVVPQESMMFEGSVADNVGYGESAVSATALEAALRDANAWEFVQALPDGVQTDIGPRGFTLSGGQKQRLAIARALLRNPRILILDEATSALDTESEALVQQALSRLMRGRTTFVIAHRLSTIKDADRILVLEESRLVEQGRHEQLVSAGGLYSRLHASAES